MKTPPGAYMNASEILDYTIEIFKKTFGQQMIVTGIMFLVSAISVSVISVALGVAGVIRFMNDIMTETYSGELIEFLLIAAFVIILIMSLVSSVKLSASMVLAKQAFFNEKPDTGKAFSTAFKSVFRIFSVLIATFIMFLPLILILFLIFFSYAMYLSFNFLSLPQYGYFNDFSSGMVFTAILVVLGFMFVTYCLYTVSAVAIPVSLFEKRYFFGAIKKSFTLIKKEFWKIFGLILIQAVVIYCISYCFLTVFDLANIIAVLSDEFLDTEIGDLVAVTSVIRMLASLALSVIFEPLSSIFTSVLYLNQKVKHEGLDIEIKIERLKTMQTVQAGASYDV